MPDTRHVLKVLSVAVHPDSSAVFCVDSRGGVWAQLKERGLCRWDGSTWMPVSGEKPLERVRLLLPGQNGDVIVGASNRFGYFADGRTDWYHSVRELISASQAEIARSFSAGARVNCWNLPTGVVADASGSIWLLQPSQELSVLVEGLWVSAKPAPIEAGSRVGHAGYLGPVGPEGALVYLTDFGMLHDHGRSFFGQVVNGKLVFSRAPHASESNLTRLSVRDHEGGLWIPAIIRESAGTCDHIIDQLAIRVTDDGRQEPLKNVGWAKLCDATGNVWLHQIPGVGYSEYHIWREGRIVSRTRVPTSGEGARLFSDRPGSVYVWTAHGLHHLVARDPQAPASFELSKTYWLDGLAGRVTNVRYSPLGYLVVASYSDAGGRSYHLGFVKLPSGPNLLEQK